MPRPVKFELRVPDPLKTAAFYEQAFGWIFTMSRTEPDTWDITTGSRSATGVNGVMTTSEASPATVLTIRVDDLDSAVDRITRIGGTLLRRSAAEALCADPSGMAFCLSQAVSEDGDEHR